MGGIEVAVAMGIGIAAVLFMAALIWTTVIAGQGSLEVALALAICIVLCFSIPFWSGPECSPG